MNTSARCLTAAAVFFLILGLYTHAQASAPTITAPSSVCANTGSHVAYVTGLSGQTYGWSISGGTITAGANSTSITFAAGSGANLQLTLRATNAFYTETFASLAGWTDDLEGTVSHVASGGNPGGHLRLTFAAPAPPPGDQYAREAIITADAGASGGNLVGNLNPQSSDGVVIRFDFRPVDELPDEIYLDLEGNGDLWSYNIDPSEFTLNAWNTVTIPLDANDEGWSTAGLGSALAFLAAQQSVDQLGFFIVQYLQSSARYDVDNFEIIDLNPSVSTAIVNVNPAAVGGTATAADSILGFNGTTTITLSGQAGDIQWQSSLDNTTYSNLTGETGTLLDTGNLTTTRYYRAVLTSSICAPATSTVATVIVRPPLTPTLATPSGVRTNQFRINWNLQLDAVSFFVDVNTSAGFDGTVIGGYDGFELSTNFVLVTGLTQGQTYYYRVKARNPLGDSAFSSTGQVTLPGSLFIQPVDDAPVAGVNEATLAWTATPNASYRIYRTGSSPDDANSWQLSETVNPGSSDAQATVTENSFRTLFRIVVEGSDEDGATSENPVFGIIKPLIPSGYSLMSPPLTGNRAFNGSFGTNLAVGLTGGTLASPNDRVLIREGAGWRTIYLHTSGAWYEGASPSTYELAEGQGFYIYRSGAPVRPRFTGFVGNTGNTNIAINTSWNIIGPSQGKDVGVSELTFEGTPTVGSRPSVATYDRIVVLDNGNWRVFSRFSQNGSDVWIDSATGQQANYDLQPGVGAYYFRHGGDPLKVNF